MSEDSKESALQAAQEQPAGFSELSRKFDDYYLDYTAKPEKLLNDLALELGRSHLPNAKAVSKDLPSLFIKTFALIMADKKTGLHEMIFK
jgi:hypothetical protein